MDLLVHSVQSLFSGDHPVVHRLQSEEHEIEEYKSLVIGNRRWNRRKAQKLILSDIERRIDRFNNFSYLLLHEDEDILQQMVDILCRDMFTICEQLSDLSNSESDAMTVLVSRYVFISSQSMKSISCWIKAADILQALDNLLCVLSQVKYETEFYREKVLSVIRRASISRMMMEFPVSKKKEYDRWNNTLLQFIFGAIDYWDGEVGNLCYSDIIHSILRIQSEHLSSQFVKVVARFVITSPDRIVKYLTMCSYIPRREMRSDHEFGESSERELLRLCDAWLVLCARCGEDFVSPVSESNSIRCSLLCYFGCLRSFEDLFLRFYSHISIRRKAAAGILSAVDGISQMQMESADDDILIGIEKIYERMLDERDSHIVIKAVHSVEPFLLRTNSINNELWNQLFDMTVMKVDDSRKIVGKAALLAIINLVEKNPFTKSFDTLKLQDIRDQVEKCLKSYVQLEHEVNEFADNDTTAIEWCREVYKNVEDIELKNKMDTVLGCKILLGLREKLKMDAHDVDIQSLSNDFVFSHLKHIEQNDNGEIVDEAQGLLRSTTREQLEETFRLVSGAFEFSKKVRDCVLDVILRAANRTDVNQDNLALVARILDLPEVDVNLSTLVREGLLDSCVSYLNMKLSKFEDDFQGTLRFFQEKVFASESWKENNVALLYWMQSIDDNECMSRANGHIERLFIHRFTDEGILFSSLSSSQQSVKYFVVKQFEHTVNCLLCMFASSLAMSTVVSENVEELIFMVMNNIYDSDKASRVYVALYLLFKALLKDWNLRNNKHIVRLREFLHSEVKLHMIKRHLVQILFEVSVLVSTNLSSHVELSLATAYSNQWMEYSGDGSIENCLLSQLEIVKGFTLGTIVLAKKPFDDIWVSEEQANDSDDSSDDHVVTRVNEFGAEYTVQYFEEMRRYSSYMYSVRRDIEEKDGLFHPLYLFVVEVMRTSECREITELCLEIMCTFSLFSGQSAETVVSLFCQNELPSSSIDMTRCLPLLCLPALTRCDLTVERFTDCRLSISARVFALLMEKKWVKSPMVLPVLARFMCEDECIPSLELFLRRWFSEDRTCVGVRFHDLLHSLCPDDDSIDMSKTVKGLLALIPKKSLENVTSMLARKMVDGDDICSFALSELQPSDSSLKILLADLERPSGKRSKFLRRVMERPILRISVVKHLGRCKGEKRVKNILTLIGELREEDQNLVGRTEVDTHVLSELRKVVT